MGQKTINNFQFTIYRCLKIAFIIVCASGWQEYGSKCFYFSGKDTVKDFTLGESKCKSLNPKAHLTSILSQEENDWILGKFL